VITRKGIKADPDKIEAVKTFPSPNSTKELQSFLGLSNYYRRFIYQYADIARPLTKLLRKGVAFTWTPDCQEAMQKLKEALMSSPVLTYPDFRRPFVLSTDASNFAVGADLSQVINGEEHPIAYASRQLNTAETNYSTTEKELLAIVFGVTHFKCYLIGAKFQIVTDHAALKWLFSLKDPSSRLLRWTLKLGEYNYEVTYKPGKKHLNADGLSRKIRRANGDQDEELIATQKRDAECQGWRTQQGFRVENGILEKLTPQGPRIVIPEGMRQEVSQQLH
jgi:hypothetical protein